MHEKRKNRIWATLIIVLFLALAILSVFLISGKKQEVLPLSERIPNNGEVIAAIREGLREHSRRITVEFSYGGNVLMELGELVGDWMEEALAETDIPTEGDYIRYQYGGYSITSSFEQKGGAYDYTVEIIPEYYLYLVEEEAVTAQLEQVMADFGFDDTTSDYEKVKVIYDYVCRNVRYDKVHRNHPTATMRSTAYSALIWHTATCQGYCVLLYRMLRSAGVNTRIVTGTAIGADSEEFHAWNIVELDGLYYAVDATWDAGQENYRYFLKGASFFADHIPGAAFSTEEFTSRYPMAGSDYGMTE